MDTVKPIQIVGIASLLSHGLMFIHRQLRLCQMAGSKNGEGTDWSIDWRGIAEVALAGHRP